MSQLQQENLLSQILQKPKKDQKDAEVIFEIIRNFRFFENFFAQNLRTMDFSDILSLCKGFEYEKVSQGEFLFQKGDPSHNKFFVIISGKVGIIIPKEDQAPSPLLLRSLRGHILRKEGSKKKLAFKRKEDLKQLAINLGRVISKDPAPESLTEKERSPKQVKAGQTTLRSIAGPLSFMYPKEKEEKKGEAQQMDYVEEPVETTTRNDEEKPKVIEEPENLSGLADPQKFEEYASVFGTFIRYYEEGESFGELALKNDTPRAASVLCSTDCEFLVISKQQFDMIFLKKEKEKEAFLKGIFPFMDSIPILTFNYVLFSFKTEVFSKGNYLIKEGTPANQESKFYVIHEGECLVEKNVSIQVSNPLDKKKGGVQNTQSAQIAVIGRGMLAGEEIMLYNNDTYNYSVKASSENVVVYSVTKTDFESKYFREFYSQLAATYDTKKRQRDITLENIKKDFEAKAEELKNRGINIAATQKSQKTHQIATSTLQSFTPYLHKKNETEDFQQRHLMSPTQSHFKVREMVKMPEITRSHGNSVHDLRTLESMKLFETETPKKAIKNRFSNLNVNLSPKTSTPKSRFSTDIELNQQLSPLLEPSKEGRKLKPFKYEDRELPSLDRLASPTSSFGSVKLPSLGHEAIKKVDTNFINFVSPFSTGSPFQLVESSSLPIQTEPTSPPGNLPLKKVKTSNFDKLYKPSQFKGRPLNRSGIDDDIARNVETETDERLGVYAQNQSRQVNEACELSVVDQKPLLAKDWASTFKKSKSTHNVRLQKAKDWRSKIFQKTNISQKPGLLEQS